MVRARQSAQYQMGRSHNKTFKPKLKRPNRPYSRPWVLEAADASARGRDDATAEHLRALRTRRDAARHSERMHRGRSQRAQARECGLRGDAGSSEKAGLAWRAEWNQSTFTAAPAAAPMLNSQEFRDGLVTFEPVKALPAPAREPLGVAEQRDAQLLSCAVALQDWWRRRRARLRLNRLSAFVARRGPQNTPTAATKEQGAAEAPETAWRREVRVEVRRRAAAGAAVVDEAPAGAEPPRVVKALLDDAERRRRDCGNGPEADHPDEIEHDLNLAQLEHMDFESRAEMAWTAGLAKHGT